MRMRVVITRLCLLVLLASSFSVQALSVVDTGAYLSPNTKIFWVDDDTVIFGGFRGEPGVPRQLRPPWSTPGYTARFLEYRYSARQLADRGLILSIGPCFDGGYVRYAKPIPETEGAALEGKWQPYYGAYGREMPLLTRPPQGTPLLESWNCKFEHELVPLPEWAKGKDVRRLRPEHGFLEFSQRDLPGDPMYPTRFYRPTDSAATGIPLEPLKRLDTYWPPTYQPWIGAYLISGRRVAPDTGTFLQHELWRLYTDGRLEQVLAVARVPNTNREYIVSLPMGRKARVQTEVSSIVPLGQSNYIFRGGAMDKRGLGDSGLYVLGPAGVTKLAKARVSAPSLSPNGCRAAVGLDPQEHPGPDQFRLHIIDGCEER